MSGQGQAGGVVIYTKAWLLSRIQIPQWRDVATKAGNRTTAQIKQLANEIAAAKKIIEPLELRNEGKSHDGPYWVANGALRVHALNDKCDDGQPRFPDDFQVPVRVEAGDEADAARYWLTEGQVGAVGRFPATAQEKGRAILPIWTRERAKPENKDKTDRKLQEEIGALVGVDQSTVWRHVQRAAKKEATGAEQSDAQKTSVAVQRSAAALAHSLEFAPAHPGLTEAALEYLHRAEEAVPDWEPRGKQAQRRWTDAILNLRVFLGDATPAQILRRVAEGLKAHDTRSTREEREGVEEEKASAPAPSGVVPSAQAHSAGPKQNPDFDALRTEIEETGVLAPGPKQPKPLAVPFDPLDEPAPNTLTEDESAVLRMFNGAGTRHRRRHYVLEQESLGGANYRERAKQAIKSLEAKGLLLGVLDQTGYYLPNGKEDSPEPATPPGTFRTSRGHLALSGMGVSP